MSDMNIGGLGPISGPSFEPKNEGTPKDNLAIWCEKRYNSLSDSLSATSITNGPPISYTNETVVNAKEALTAPRPNSVPSKERAEGNLKRLASSQSKGAPEILKNKRSSDPGNNGNSLILNSSISFAMVQNGRGEAISGETIDPLEGLRSTKSDDESDGLSGHANKV